MNFEIWTSDQEAIVQLFRRHITQDFAQSILYNIVVVSHVHMCGILCRKANIRYTFIMWESQLTSFVLDIQKICSISIASFTYYLFRKYKVQGSHGKQWWIDYYEQCCKKLWTKCAMAQCGVYAHCSGRINANNYDVMLSDRLRHGPNSLFLAHNQVRHHKFSIDFFRKLIHIKSSTKLT